VQEAKVVLRAVAGNVRAHLKALVARSTLMVRLGRYIEWGVIPAYLPRAVSRWRVAGRPRFA